MLKYPFMDDLVSIIIPAHNAAKTIESCVNSILHQTFQHTEIVIVENASNDDTLKICKELEKNVKRVHLITTDEASVSNARNIGLKFANGKYICFVDADDELRLDHIKSYYEEMKASGCDLVYSSAINITYSTTEILTLPHYERHNIASRPVDVYRIFYLTIWRGMFKKEIINKFKLKFMPMRISEDQLFVLQYLSHCKTYSFIDTMSYLYTNSDNSALITINDNFEVRLDETSQLFRLLNEIKNFSVITGCDPLDYSSSIISDSLYSLMLHNTFRRKQKRTIPEQRNHLKKINALFVLLDMRVPIYSSKHVRHIMKCIKKKYYFVAWFMMKLMSLKYSLFVERKMQSNK